MFSPEAAVGGNIALVEEGDIIDIDIMKNQINMRVSDEELEKRRRRMDAEGAAYQDRLSCALCVACHLRKPRRRF